MRDAKPLYEGEAVNLLGRFLFRYEQVREPVRNLSGGERTRLQLLLLMLGGHNCLILDEPTNHLDIDSLEVLERELERFPGTVVFVSHDRYFLDRISDKTVEVRDAGLYRYEGGYSAWRHSKEGQRGRISASAAGQNWDLTMRRAGRHLALTRFGGRGRSRNTQSTSSIIPMALKQKKRSSAGD